MPWWLELPRLMTHCDFRMILKYANVIDTEQATKLLKHILKNFPNFTVT